MFCILLFCLCETEIIQSTFNFSAFCVCQYFGVWLLALSQTPINVLFENAPCKKVATLSMALIKNYSFDGNPKYIPNVTTLT